VGPTCRHLLLPPAGRPFLPRAGRRPSLRIRPPRVPLPPPLSHKWRCRHPLHRLGPFPSPETAAHQAPATAINGRRSALTATALCASSPSSSTL
jgi:hypothetical protein